MTGMASRGNSSEPLRDYYPMDCDPAREAISGLLDNELNGAAPSAIEEHLEGCADCRRWREEAHEVTRRVRLAAALPVPAPSSSLLAAVTVLDRRRRWWRSLAFARNALVLVAVGQLIITIPPLLLGTDHDAPIHVAHEMGSFCMALAVGFLIAAWQPARAYGMRTLVGCAAFLLVATAVIDLLAGRTSPSDEAPHLLALVGWLLLWRISVLAPPTTDQPGLLRPLLAQLGTRTRPPSISEPPPRTADRDTHFDDPVVPWLPVEAPVEHEPPRRRAVGGR